jgi:formylglycine-generating enzyme required for sulfatase activity
MGKIFLIIVILMALILPGCGQQQDQSISERGGHAPPTSTQVAMQTATPEPVSPIVREKDGMVMVFVPAGEFMMGGDADVPLALCQKDFGGCSRDRYTDEEPPHLVYLGSYWIDQTEVTRAMYKQCVIAKVCDSPPTSNFAKYATGSYANHPANFVAWDQAKSYCEWVGANLPTEAQWEKAARGTDGRMYPWGEEIDCTRTNYDGCTEGGTSTVGSYFTGASPYGALDMAGNVDEWVADWYDANYYKISPSSNPQGPTSGNDRVVRGGAWGFLENYVRSASRDKVDPTMKSDITGFRCARDAAP